MNAASRTTRPTCKRRWSLIRRAEQFASTKCTFRRGVVTLELILVLPIILIVGFAVFEFGLIQIVGQAIEMAAIEGAREKAKGRPDAEIIATVDQFLQVHNIAPGDRRIIIDVGAVTTTDTGPLSIPITVPTIIPAPDEVRVRVCLFISQNDKPVPDILKTFGLSLSGRMFEFTSLAESE